MPTGPFKISIVMAGASGVLYYQKEHNSFFDRSLKFWTRAFPILVHYRYADFKSRITNQPEDERDAMFNCMHHRYADELLATILELRGFYIKLGQNMATRADILPPRWIERLRTLEDQGASARTRLPPSLPPSLSPK